MSWLGLPMIHSIAALVSLSIAFIFILFQFIRGKKKTPSNWPILGMLPGLLLNVHRLHDYLTDILRETGHTFVFHGPWFFRQKILLTCHEADMNYTLKSSLTKYNRVTPDFVERFDILGDGLVSSSGDSWRLQRKMAQNQLHRKQFRLFAATNTALRIKNGLLPILDHVAQQGKALDLSDVLGRFIFDNMCSLVLGDDPGCLSIEFPVLPIVKAFRDAEEAIAFRFFLPTSLWKLMRWLNVGKEKQGAMARKIIDPYLFQCISKKAEESKKFQIEKKLGDDKEATCTDLLTSYLNYNQLHDDEKGVTESHEFLRDTTINLIGGGKDSSIMALTWFFLLLSKNPQVEARILEELRSNLAANEERMLGNDKIIDGLVYLHAALCESLRLFPAIPFIRRTALQSDVLPSGIKVQPGVTILYCLYAMGRMEDIWGKDCLEFKPERWISKRGILKPEHSKFMSFSAGPRNCVGQNLGYIQMKIVASAILYNFHVHVLENQHVTHIPSVVLQMKKGLMVRLAERCP